MADLILNEILFPRYGALGQLVSDNGQENVNRIMAETLASLNIAHITTFHYHLESNTKVERFHRTLGDILVKLA